MGLDEVKSARNEIKKGNSLRNERQIKEYYYMNDYKRSGGDSG